MMKAEQLFQEFENNNDSYSYNCLVKRIKEQEVLVEWLENNVKNDPRTINLVTSDWHSVLKNNPTFQEYLNGNVKFFKYDSMNNKALCNYKVQNYSKNINVIVIGTFKLVYDEKDGQTKLKLIDCIPLQCISEIMCLPLEKTVLHNPKFFTKGCRGSCSKCKEYNIKDEAKWCLRRSLVYEAEQLVFGERAYCESLFQDESKVIVELEIDNAYTFGDKCKIGGSVKSMVFVEDCFTGTSDNIKGILKKDENYVPTERREEQRELKRKRMSDDETLDDIPKCEESKRVKFSDEEKMEDLALPRGIKYVKPEEKTFEVKSTIKPMPKV